MTAHQDIFPWPYDWSQDIDPRVRVHLQVLKQFYPDLEFWTYNNHWWVHMPPPEPQRQWLVDFYWEDPDWDRGQVPPAQGDLIVETLIELFGPEISCIVWMNRIWRRETGWLPYHGNQGDFVDHIHTEWDHTKFESSPD